MLALKVYTIVRYINLHFTLQYITLCYTVLVQYVLAESST